MKRLLQRSTRPGWPGNLLAVIAGAITTLALAPTTSGLWRCWQSACSMPGCAS
ncbi:hypothetical protein PBOI14_68220 [Pseudomonas sp. Boi14]|nr:hypothetical protein PBOI14_68220 [Pseudomonas sp. Boi14]